MAVPIELIGKELLNGTVAKLARRQTDGVNHNQVDVGGDGPFAKIGRLTLFGALTPTLLPKIEIHDGQ
jgi:hypothetical protein